MYVDKAVSLYNPYSDNNWTDWKISAYMLHILLRLGLALWKDTDYAWDQTTQEQITLARLRDGA